MIRTIGEAVAYRTIFSSSAHQAVADAPVEKGGAGVGFDPHELLEAAFATCISIFVRKRASQLNIPIDSVATVVRLDRSSDDLATFEYELDIRGAADAAQLAQLYDAVKTCPVTRTLSKKIEFRINKF